MNQKSEKNIKILLLEDDYTLSEIIQEFLEESGFEVVCVYDGNEVFDKIYEVHFDLFLFDAKVPIKNGFDILAELRAESNHTPTIFITSLSSMEDLTKAYDRGCDDYLRKPFELEELLLRIKTLLKRNFTQRVVTNKIEILDGFAFEIDSHRLFYNQNEILLTKKEGKILKELLKKRGEIVSNELLFKAAWSYDEEYSEESLRTHIKDLRKIFGKENILNFRAQGYKFAQS